MSATLLYHGYEVRVRRQRGGGWVWAYSPPDGVELATHGVGITASFETALDDALSSVRRDVQWVVEARETRASG